MTDDDPNEAYEVVPIEPGPHGPPKGWWTVKRNGLPVGHFPGKEKAAASGSAQKAAYRTRPPNVKLSPRPDQRPSTARKVHRLFQSCDELGR
jgi:hypothetical protein